MDTHTLYNIFLKYPNICIDSRNAKENSIFFALKGDNFDGNQYAEKALEKCEYAVVDNKDVIKNDKYILVDDVLKSLQYLAKYHRKRLGIPIIAITGTNGKTTTKELIYRVLSEKFNTAYTQGNFNNHIGVPLTLLSMNKNHEFGVVEMGANHIGEIELLCKITAPDFGIITNVGKAHLEGFNSFEGVIKAKSELYKYLYENDGIAFVNYDNEILEDMKPPHNIIYYGTKEFTHCQGKIKENGIFLTVQWIASEDIINNKDLIAIKENKLIKTKLYGEYNFENVMAAICVGNYFHVSDIKIKKAVESYEPQNNRSQIVNTKTNTLIVDCYNANPSSMKAALTNFNKIQVDNKIIILGDMLELGSSSSREHGAIISLLEDLNMKDVYLIGDNFMVYNDKKDFCFFMDVDELNKYLQNNKIENKYILIKGSNGIKLDKVIPFL